MRLIDADALIRALDAQPGEVIAITDAAALADNQLSQLQLDDLFTEMLDRLAEIVEFTPEKSDAEQVSTLREFIWQFLARTLLLKGTP